MTAVPTFAFPDLDASHLDDTMDVASSPYRQADDIDIDFDSVHDPSVLGSVHDEMLDDTVEPTGGAAGLQDQLDDALDDDLMFDDTRQDVLEEPDTDYNMEGHVEETEGNEDEDILYEDEEEAPPSPYQNNGTVEYSDNEPQQNYDQVDVGALLAEPDRHPQPEETDDQVTNDVQSLPAGGPPRTEDEATGILDQPHNQTLEAKEYPPEQSEAHTLQDNETEKDDIVYAQPEQTQPNQQSVGYETGNEQASINQTTLEASDSVAPGENQALAKSQQDTSTEISDAYNATKAVHPVMLYYLEEEMSLFPPMLDDASSVYFLSDSSLAFGPLDQLLAACRDLLADTLDHHDELVLDVPGLGLHICEDSKYATQMTLSQILDVYLHLCHNDEGHGVQPLYCHLSSRVSLASQYAYLASAGEEGKTYTEVAADHMNSPGLESSAEAVDQTNGQHDGVGNPEPASGRDHLDEEQDTNQVHEDQQPDFLNVEDHEQIGIAAAQFDTLETTKEPAVEYPAADAGHSETHAQSDESDQEGSAPAAVQDLHYDQAPTLESDDPVPNQTSEILEAVIHNRDDDSNSSHTLEGDVMSASLQTNAADHAGFDQSNELPEDLLEADESILESQHEYEPIGDEEYFPAQDEEDESAEQDGVEDFATEVDTSTLAEVSEHGLTQSATSLSGDGKHPGRETRPSESNTTASISGNPSPPLTPKGAKRKVEEDDELLFLDLDTPDAKRRRPS